VRIDRALPWLLLALPCACSSSDERLDGLASGSPARSPALSEPELALRIERGRALLDAGRPDEAEALFAAAAVADGQTLRTRMWVLRAWMDQGRSNDTLDALDELNRAGEKGMELNYLFGMAFARRAEGYLSDGVTDSSVQMNFLDATNLLAQAVEADPERFRDAFLPLARSAWYVQELETARWAADRAVELYADSPEAWLERGRIAMSEFVVAQQEEPSGARAEELWSTASASFQRAIERFGAPTEEAAQLRLAEAATQLGHAMLWKQRAPEATEAYATAISWDPQGFAYGTAADALSGAPRAPEDERPSGFRAALELAKERFEARAMPGDPRTATLAWWLGWARFVEADWAGSEAAFQESLRRAPEYANAWFFVALSRQYRHDSEGALAAMRSGWEAEPTAMVAAIADAGGSLRAFEDLLGWCATQEPPRNLDAAFLCEMLTTALPLEPRYWNNLGLFLRDEGERLETEAHVNQTPAPDPALLADLYARSYAAYQRALELNPEDPQLINDAALMLTYHVGGERSEIEAMYLRAMELVEARLATETLSEEDRARFEQTREDIGVNLKALLEAETEEEKPAVPVQESANDGGGSSSGNGR
jgi:hypothetical protein